MELIQDKLDVKNKTRANPLGGVSSVPGGVDSHTLPPVSALYPLVDGISPCTGLT